MEGTAADARPRSRPRGSAPTSRSASRSGATAARGVGLSTGGDAVNVFDSLGNRVTGVRFGTVDAPASRSTTRPGSAARRSRCRSISTLSVAGTNGAFLAADGSRDRLARHDAPADRLRGLPVVQRQRAVRGRLVGDDEQGRGPVVVAGWKMDDDSNVFANAVALNGVTTIAPGKSAVFIEGTRRDGDRVHDRVVRQPTCRPAFPIGTYSGSGVSLSTGGDPVNIFDSFGNRVTGVRFGTSTTGFTFDNAAGIGSARPCPAVISTLSVAGDNGAFLAARRRRDRLAGPRRQRRAPPALSVTNTPNGLNGWNVGDPVTVTITASDARPVCAARRRAPTTARRSRSRCRPGHVDGDARRRRQPRRPVLGERPRRQPGVGVGDGEARLDRAVDHDLRCPGRPDGLNGWYVTARR